MTETCPHTPLPGSGGTRRGPSVERVSYQLAMNGGAHFARAALDVATWVDRVHFAAVAAQTPSPDAQETDA